MPLLPVAIWSATFLGLAGTRLLLRESALIALTVVVTSALVITESLSALQAFSLPWVAVAWLLVLATSLLLTRKTLADGCARLRDTIATPWRLSDSIAWLILGAFAGATLLSATLYPTTNYDSLTYHMPRVIFWFQNHSIERYATAEGRQLFSGPLVEYLVFNLKVLAFGSDRLANLVQWTSYLFSCVTTSLIAERLGASRRGQQLTAIATAAVPMAALQASTTQNDLTAALWCLVFAYCLTTMFRLQHATALHSFGYAGWAGASLGFAILTKPTAYLVGAPFVLWFAVAATRRSGWLPSLRLVATIGLAVVIVNATWYGENARLFGWDVIGVNAPGMEHILIRKHDPASIATALLENASLEVETPSDGVNGRITRAVRSFIRLYGGSPDDPAIRESDAGPFILDSRVTVHDVAPAPFTMVLLGYAGLLLLTRRARGLRGYSLAALFAFLLVASAINWNHFTNRLLLGALLLLVPLVGVAYTLLEDTRWRLARALLLALLVAAVGWGGIVVAFNLTNRVVPLAVLRPGIKEVGWWNTSYDQLRFRTSIPPLEVPLTRVAEKLKAERVARLAIDQHAVDFPILPLLQLLPNTTFAYVGHTVLPGRFASPAFAPQAVLEIVPEAEYAVQHTSRVREKDLMLPPQHGLGWVMVLHRVQ